MNIYDNGYLTEDEKHSMPDQLLIDLAIANYTENPPKEMYPKDVYKYMLDYEGKICRLHYQALHPVQAQSEVAWEVYVNCGKEIKFRHSTYSLYYLTGYLDDDGNEHSIDIGKIPTYIPVEKAGWHDIEYYKKNCCAADGVYFLAWVSDELYKEFFDAKEKETDE